jgi:hypothetical protein
MKHSQKSECPAATGLDAKVSNQRNDFATGSYTSKAESTLITEYAPRAISLTMAVTCSSAGPSADIASTSGNGMFSPKGLGIQNEL